jgi:hypothetical protein
VGPVEFNKEEIEYGEQIMKSCPPNDIVGLGVKIFGKEAREFFPPDAVFLTCVMPNTQTDYVLPGSTDVGDVSWVMPTGQISVTTMTACTPGHSWQIVAQSDDICRESHGADRAGVHDEDGSIECCQGGIREKDQENTVCLSHPGWDKTFLNQNRATHQSPYSFPDNGQVGRISISSPSV